MTESMFSIFPDGRLTSGHELKGNVPRSKKKALCDVKNTLLARRPALNEPLRKLNLDSGAEGACKQTAKESVKESSGKLTLRQEGTFTIACDKENDDSWNKCGECQQPEDSFLPERSSADCLKNVDIDYIVERLFCLGYEEPLELPEKTPVCMDKMRRENCFDIEINIPWVSALDLEPASPIELFDEE